MRLSGYGASYNGGSFVSGFGLTQDASHSRRLQSVSAGASCVTVVPAAAGTISGVANNGSGRIRLTVNSSANYSVGQWIFVSGVAGADYVNGNQLVTAIVDGTHIDVRASFDVSRPYTSGGTIGSGISLFVAGKWALITGYDIQGLWLAAYGFPPNLHYFEYVKIASVDSGAGQVCFEVPLRHNYLSTWPSYNSGTAFEIDNGGPATLYALLDDWDTEVDIRGVTITYNSQIYGRNRRTIYRDVKFTNGSTPVPTINEFFGCYGCTVGVIIEVDKLVKHIELRGGTYTTLDFQSSSIDTLVADRVTASFVGTAKKAVITNSVLANLRPGAFAYGRSDETICSSCVISSFSKGGIEEKGPSDAGVNVGYTMSSGIITVANTLNAVRWAVPGTNLFWAGANVNETAFQVTGVTQDETNTYVQTTLAGGFPGVPLTAGKLYIHTHPAPKFTCVNCTGTSAVIDLSQATAQAPLYSYSSRTYHGTQIGTQSDIKYGASLWGVVTMVRWDVTSAYTGAEALSLHGMHAFDIYATIKADYSQGNYVNAVINLKQTGNRVVTGSSNTVSCNGTNGSCSGDSSLLLPEANAWFTNEYNIAGSADISASCGASPSVGCPSVTIEVTTDQGVVNP